ncbi:RDD family protein [Sphingomonas sp. So64.6b]|uniref:RDD family protein n=1 Tax=Sphingomonas sp. So64.6b TaxID=2997354 RepID=UPI00160496DA|nr:RDD family protein [Sphingomonas sp. So64.6b]QNA83322.1 RDD family protein [Sphingomonas sp. So64.6b]
MRWPFRRKDRGPKSLRRSFVTPEGVDLQLELGGAGVRAAAFMIDAVAILVVLIILTIIIGLLLVASRSSAMAILWLIGFFILRNGWFVLFEMGGRGATPGKRLLGLRVVARDGARLSGGAVLARNAMREIEVFLPLSFLAAQTAQGMADSFLVIFALSWSGIFLFFPLFNRDRLRVGDLVAGTWVVRTVSGELGADIVGAVERARWNFTDAELSLYGEFELQTLENVLRSGREEAVATVAATIRAKAGMEEPRHYRAGDDFRFLSDYYAALCARLERGMMVGRRRADKNAEVRVRQ